MFTWIFYWETKRYCQIFSISEPFFMPLFQKILSSVSNCSQELNYFIVLLFTVLICRWKQIFRYNAYFTYSFLYVNKNDFSSLWYHWVQIYIMVLKYNFLSLAKDQIILMITFFLNGRIVIQNELNIFKFQVFLMEFCTL